MNQEKGILVTGGAGCIGSNIVEALVARGKKVTVIDDFSAGFEENLKPFARKIRLVRGDIRNAADVRKSLKGVGVVIHQAAIRSVPKSVKNPHLSHEVNSTGTLVLLEESVRQGIRRFVYASSSSVYGSALRFPQSERDTPKPISPYGVSKLCGEMYCHAFKGVHGLETVSLRYFNVYGLRQNPESLYSLLIPALLDKLIKGQRPVIDGTGKQSRDFTFVGDVVRANLLAAFGPAKAAGMAFNIAGGRDYSVLEILARVQKILGTKIRPAFGPRRPGDPMRTRADISLASKYLDWRPRVSLEQGLQKTIEWFLAHKPAIKK